MELYKQVAYTKLFVCILALFPALTHADFSNTINIVAAVPAMQFIVVNDQNIIQKITSNSPLNVQPTVVRNNLYGKEIEFTNNIAEQYDQLLPSLDFLNFGVLYERKIDLPIISLWQILKTIFLIG